LNAIVTIVFMLLCTCSIIHDVVVRAQITMENLRGVVCAYFMVGLLFGYAYFVIEYVNPGSFQISDSAVVVSSFAHYLSEMLYFSFVTILCVGYGDIVPVKEIAQTAAVFEGIFGQFYIAILVARIVAAYTIRSDAKLVKKIEENFQ
jgi:hypothetical protein